jgi:hypothetical protein
VHFSPHSLHPVIIQTDAQKTELAEKLRTIITERLQRRRLLTEALSSASAVIPLTTVSLNTNFDAYINIRFRGQAPTAATTLVVDSGNSTLIVPAWEDIKDLPGYTVLGDAKEPWGSPAKVVRGPIEIPTESGELHVLESCVFYACTGAPRTANFGTGCISPWATSGWNTPLGIGNTMQSPLSYNTQYPFAEFNYAPAASVLALSNTLRVAQESQLVVSKTQPAGYTTLDIIPNVEWMSLIPKSLTVGSTLTQWPGTVETPIAMVDTGGGPVYLSDPNGYVYNSTWPQPTACPWWASTSDHCTCVSDNATIELWNSGKTASYKYTIHPHDLPPSVQGLTLVMCKVNAFMMGQQGMNIGGISALFNNILIDYSGNKVGLKLK